MRFALCGIAGALAVRLGILPEKLNVLSCIETCFPDWLTVRGGTGASEDAAILSTVRLFIEQHGASRFQDWDTQTSTCVKRVGFRRKVNGETEYIVLPESFKAGVIKGYPLRRAGEVLRTAGWLHPSDGGSTIKGDLLDMGESGPMFSSFQMNRMRRMPLPSVSHIQNHVGNVGIWTRACHSLLCADHIPKKERGQAGKSGHKGRRPANMPTFARI